MMRTVFSLFALLAAHAAAQQTPYPPHFDGAREEVYKTIGDVKMKLYIFEPKGHTAADKRAAIVFFFGGGWTNGNPKQFEQHSRVLAAKGMVAITADYRVASRHQVKVVDCVRDAKSAIRYVRANAARLGIDPDRIAAGGGSAGGHLAAATGVIAGLDEASENGKISSRPNAMVLFNPALVLGNLPGEPKDAEDRYSQRTGIAPEKLSPWHQVAKSAPPAIVFHGKADTTVPYAKSEAFCAKMKESGNRCELVGYEGQAHGFFNYERGDGKMYQDTSAKMVRFLAALGYMK
ncbi:MAG: alpha/beta hydrolase [Candidatus Solibacter usitatus]|nr:alpha/beta hydrolase [Candidatus Solibacter usitatus]